MKILITGGAGFVGGNLATKFADEGNEVLCLDNLSRRGSENNLTRFLNYPRIKFVHGDIRNSEDLDRVSFNPDVVLECSAQTTAIDGYDHPIYDYTNNTHGVINVLEFCRKKNAGLIFWSSNKAYSGDLCNSIPVTETDTRLVWTPPDDFSLQGWSQKGFNEKMDLNGGNHTIYGVTKNAADLICQEWSSAFDIPVIVNRFSCLYGPNQFGKVSQGWIVWFMLAKKFGIPLSYYGFGGKQVRDYLHIDDLFRLIYTQCLTIDNHTGSYYNVGGGVNNTTSVLELSNLLDESGFFADDVADVAHAKERKADQQIYISDISKVSNDFMWKPEVKLDNALKKIIIWINSDNNIKNWMK